MKLDKSAPFLILYYQPWANRYRTFEPRRLKCGSVGALCVYALSVDVAGIPQIPPHFYPYIYPFTADNQ